HITEGGNTYDLNLSLAQSFTGDFFHLSGDDVSGTLVTENQTAPAPPIPPPDDFRGDGSSDILWQNTDGTAAIWEMNGGTPTSVPVVGDPGPAWKVIGVGDFNADNTSDIVLQNTDGSIAVWKMQGPIITADPVIANPGTSWKAIGTGDFKGDGLSDILFQNTDGSVAIWEMNGT